MAEVPSICSSEPRPPCGSNRPVSRRSRSSSFNRTEIRLCFEEGKPTNDWVVLHEIARAWDHLNLGEATRDVFLELRGLGRWREGVWYERGAEQAAEIITWPDRPVDLTRPYREQQLPRIARWISPAHRIRAFERIHRVCMTRSLPTSF